MRKTLILFAAVSLAGLAGRGLAQSDGDLRGFVEDAIRGDNSEMMLGKLAASHAVDPAVRDYGRMLHDDHANNRDKAVAVAHQVGADVTDRSNGEAVREMSKLENTYGRAFDREFVRYMIADHKKDIAAFQDAAQRGGPAGQFAADTLPDLHRHLDMAEKLSG
ncbi:MAG: DUF4142 domain-containing protein [Proteobacteria bacterium]|nr:DUF4142 domain-containing protein [Pseudomonadota bacterium]